MVRVARRAVVLICAVVLLSPPLFVGTPAQADPLTTTASGLLKKFTSVTNHHCHDRTVNGRGKIPLMSITFTMAAPGPVAITFSAWGSAWGDDEGGTSLNVQPFVDGQVYSDWAELLWASSEENVFSKPGSFTWVVPSLAAGSHTVDMYWVAQIGGVQGGVRLCSKTLMVQYKK